MDNHVKLKLNSSFQERLRDSLEFDVFTIDIELEEEQEVYCFNSTLYAEGGRPYPTDRDLPPEFYPPFIQCNSVSLVCVNKQTGDICYLDDEAEEIVKEGISGYK
jgi:hypothetical protein